MKPIMVGFLAVFSAAASASAQVQAPNPHAAMPERPTVGTHAGTVAPGWVEIEVGVEIDDYNRSSKSGVASTAVKIGLAPRLQLNVQAPLARPAGGVTGLGDALIGLKWRIVDSAPILGDFAIFPSVKFPSGSAAAGTGSGTTDVGLQFVSSHQFGDAALDLNLGFTRRSGDGGETPRNASLWSASGGGPLRGRVGWSAEIYGYPATSGPAGSTAIVAVLVGPTCQVTDWLVLDAGIIAPIRGPQPRAIYAGFTYNVGSLGR